MRSAIYQRGATLLRAVTALTGSRSAIIVTPPSWRLRISRWLVALIACVLVFQVYAWVIVPWIEPPLSRFASGGEEPVFGSRGRDVELEELFEPEAWERNNPMELKTQWGRLLFQKYVRIDNGIELHPCTILFRAPATTGDGKRGKRTIVLKTPNKAVLSFTGEMNLVRAQVGELKGALLEGEVRIYSRETSPGAHDALNVVTRNIQVLPTQIWTPYDVAFQYGSSRGSGRVLSITIASNDENDSSDSQPALMRNIEMLELVHVDRLHLDFPGKGLLGGAFERTNQAVEQQAAARTSTPNSTAVDVTCQGPFQFDFRNGVATLQDHVDVVRVNPTGDNDQLRCDKLLIFFKTGRLPGTSALESDDGTSSDPVPSDSQRAVSRMTISRIEATGAEVVLQAPSVQAAARGQLLQYDFHTRHILLQDPRKALFAYRQHVVESPRLEYELHDDPKRLGRLWATGPGVYRGALGKRQQSLQAVWEGTLELQPQDDLHVLSVARGAEIKWGTMGSFSADKFFVWLAEMPVAWDSVPGRKNDLDPANATPIESPSEKRESEILPVKLLAQGNVRADSEQFKGEYTQLEIWFDHPASQPPDGTAAQPVANEAAPATQPATSGDAAKSKREVKRLELSGTQVRLRLWMVKPRPTVREATVVGQVRLAQLAPDPTDPIPLLVTGDMLQLRTDHLDRSTIDVRGNAARPARVQAQGMLWEGSNLHVSQRENLLRSEGPGRTRLPARAKRTTSHATGEHTLSSNAPIWISWQGGMDFDGQLIRFMKQVEVSAVYTSKAGEQLFLRSIGDQLHATLNRYVEFDKTKETDDLDVIELRFLGDVFTKNQTFGPNNALTSQDQMRARDLTLDRRTGEFSALGPGWITTTRVDKGELGDRVATAPPSRVLPQPAGAGGQEKLIYLRIDYQNAIQGNLDLREGEFVRFVRTVYGPVGSWDQILDPDRRGGLGPQGIVMTCNQLKVVEMNTGARRAIEMSAVGNTVVEGNQFLARADRLTYAEAKEQLILEGVGRNFATLQHRSRIGAEPAEFQAKKIVYGVKSGQVEVFRARKLDFNQLGSPEIPSARIR